MPAGLISVAFSNPKIRIREGTSSVRYLPRLVHKKNKLNEGLSTREFLQIDCDYASG